MIKTIATNADGMIVMTKEEFDLCLREAYNDGTRDQYLFDLQKAITSIPEEIE